MQANNTARPLSASEGKGGGARTEWARGRAPARAPLKLRFGTSRPEPCAAAGTRASRPANHRRASSRRSPMAARVLGACASQAALPLACVWARLAVGSRLGRTCSLVVRPGLCGGAGLGFVS